MKSRSLTHKFFNGLAGTIDSLNSGIKTVPLNPAIAVLSAFVLTGVATFSSDFVLQILIFTIGFVFVLVTRSRLCEWTKITFLVSIWATIVAIPVTFMTEGRTVAKLTIGLLDLSVTKEGIDTIIGFMMRVISSTAILASFTIGIGWRRIILGLESLRVPQEITYLLNILVINIPLLLRDASKMLLAREARMLKNIKVKELWIVLSTVVGDILIRGQEHAWHLENAIKARTFVENQQAHNSIRVRTEDLLLLLLTLIILVFGIWEVL